MKRFLLYFCLSLSILSYSQQKKILEKELVRSKQINSDNILCIQNVYGDINFEIWQKNEIEVRVVMEVSSDKIKDLKKYLDAINIIESTEGNEIKYVSKIDEWVFNNPIKTKNLKIKINYFVKHPVYLNSKIYNNYGNVNIDELSGNFYLNLDYGTAIINNLSPDESKKIPILDLDYSKCIIKKTKLADINANYSHIQIQEAVALSLNSSYSKVNINKIMIFKANSDNDEIFIENVSKINLNTTQTKVYITQLADNANVVAKQGFVEIKTLSANFTEGYFNMSYADLKIISISNNCLKLDANVNYSQLKLPKRANVDNYINLKNTRSKGIIGCVSQYNGTLQILADFSEIEISD
ncbi:MAG: hypothetical protein N2449_03305 [Bacteroidales bacterium]|nr:hypothetical protein [Bacteroidales bacterium]